MELGTATVRFASKQVIDHRWDTYLDHLSFKALSSQADRNIQITHSTNHPNQDLEHVSMDIDSQEQFMNTPEEEEVFEDEQMDHEVDEQTNYEDELQDVDPNSLLDQSLANRNSDHDPVNEQQDPVEIDVNNFDSKITDISTADKFIQELKTATLENSGLSEEDFHRLLHPAEESLDIEDPILHLSLDIFLAVSHASQQTYNDIRDALKRYDPSCEIYTFHQIKQKVKELSGITSVISHMCVNSCVAFTGPFKDLDTCPLCAEPRYDPLKPGKKVPRQVFHTIPVGFQLQALRRTIQSSGEMRYKMDVMFYGIDILEAVHDGRIKKEDMVLMFSVDGAQLYESKLSDCWVYIWIVLDYSPNLRYKKEHILPGGVIPGPHKPKNLDSFLFPGLYHLAALQRQGLRIWDAIDKATFISHPFLALATADGPAMAMLSGLVGHFGASGCRLFCPLRGRRRLAETTIIQHVLILSIKMFQSQTMNDILVRNIVPETSLKTSERYQEGLYNLIHSQNDREYKEQRFKTGICKPSIFSGLDARYRLPIPALFPADLMHLVSLNLTDLLISLWRGTMSCDKGDTIESWDFAVLRNATLWAAHGKEVADATSYLPGSFDRPLVTQQRKIWQNFCKLVAAIHLLHQRSITREQLQQARILLIIFLEEFETFYYQRKASRIHFCRQSIHALSHLADQVPQLGPPIYMTQFPMERIIGDLGSEIKQHSNPYANLSQRAVRRGQVNALKAMIPSLDPSHGLPIIPRGALELEDGYVLLRARDVRDRNVTHEEAAAIREFFPNEPSDWTPQVMRWARLCLPNGQVARSMWKEGRKQPDKVRMSRNVKIIENDNVHFAEVQYYFQVQSDNLDDSHIRTLAMVRPYSDPDSLLTAVSFGTVLSCSREDERMAIDIKKIKSVVGMVPHNLALQRAEQSGQIHHVVGEIERYFVIEKLGLEVALMAGITEETLEQ
ncbi:hypothetical protein A0H81_09275 [Grifola frondosa]|uniref:Transposase family Tnp2 protein n=1 Tax=Grifola frondosa TaxID=5627 RepID=A0A1C7M394_GRIFR|nr:hypothetical protein A0H81_09275 [Grifola frondosa]